MSLFTGQSTLTLCGLCCVECSCPLKEDACKTFSPQYSRNFLQDQLCSLQLYIPKEGVCIAFSPSGVRTPQRATQGQGPGQGQGQQGRPAAAAEPYSEEAFAFTRQHCLQREVRICQQVFVTFFVTCRIFSSWCQGCSSLFGLYSVINVEHDWGTG